MPSSTRGRMWASAPTEKTYQICHSLRNDIRDGRPVPYKIKTLPFPDWKRERIIIGQIKYSPKGKFSHSLHSHLFLSLFLCCPSLFFPRTSFSLPGFSMALGSVYHDLARLKRLGEIPFSFSPFLSFSFEIKNGDY